jgi:hypothetical protein
MYHLHHIIPKHMGGTDDPSNIIKLTISEHAEAHRILWEKYGRKEDELAWRGLAKLIDKKDLLHEIFVLAGQKSRPPKDHKANLGRKWSDEYKKNMSERTKGIKKTEEHKKKISEGNSRNWLIINPAGEKMEIKNLQLFCKENNLSSAKMSLVASGIRNHHKGFYCEKVKK